MVLRTLLALAIGAISLQLYRAFLGLVVFRTFALTVVSMALEGLPFLLLGALAATLVRSFLPAGVLARVAHRLGPAGIPLAALTGVVAPVCECAIVPTVRGLKERGLPLPYAMTVLVAVPLLNPIVLASTLAAFPGRPEIVLARFLGGGAIAVAVGLVFFATRRSAEPTTPTPLRKVPPLRRSRRGIGEIVDGTIHEFLEIGGYYIVGVSLSALIGTLVPPEQFTALAGSTLAAALVMIVLAYVLSVCSEADAFIGKSFLALLPAPAVVAFLVFGPMLDLKNTVMLRTLITRRQLLLLAGVLTALTLMLALLLGEIWS